MTFAAAVGFVHGGRAIQGQSGGTGEGEAREGLVWLKLTGGG